MIARGYIRPSNSSFGAPLLFTKKKDGSLQPCIDYRKINAVTRKVRYTLPPINHLLEQIHKAKIFTKIDLRGAFNLIRVAEGHEQYTAFRTRYGLFEYLVMPFSLANAPPTFQRMVNEMLQEYVDRFVIVYIDDILVFSDTEANHVEHVRLVLEQLRKFNLYAKATKAPFTLRLSITSGI